MNFAKRLLSFSLALAAAGVASCSIPKPECTVGQTSTVEVGLTGIPAFATRYKLISGTGECAGLKGEIVGFQSFHPEKKRPPGDTSSPVRDFSKTSIAIRPHNLGELEWLTEDTGAVGDVVRANSVGDFTETDPDSTDMCHVPVTVEPAQVIFPGAVVPADTGVPCDVATVDADCVDIATPTCEPLPEAPPAGKKEGTCFTPITLPATDMKYEWKNLEFYVTAGAPGTQFKADLTFTLNGCIAEYKAIGMWPAVDCSAEYNEAGEVIAGDEQLCNPEPDAEGGRPIGSGINPDFGPLKCEVEDFKVAPVLDIWYKNFAGACLSDECPYPYAPLSVARCVLAEDEIPALGGFKASTTE